MVFIVVRKCCTFVRWTLVLVIYPAGCFLDRNLEHCSIVGIENMFFHFKGR